MTLTKIQKILNSSNDSDYSIYFLKRDKINGKISYSVIKSKQTKKLGAIFKKDAEYATSKFIKRKLLKYSDVLYQVRNNIQCIPHEEVPNFIDIINSCITRKSDNITNAKELAENLWGYVIRVKVNENLLYLFFKYRPSELLETKKSLFQMNGKTITPINKNNAFSLSREYDAIVMYSPNNNPYYTSIYISNRIEFEEFFSFKEYYKSYIVDNKNKIENVGLIDNVDSFVNRCSKNFLFSIRLARIIQKGKYESMHIDIISKLISEHNLKVKIQNNKIVYNNDYADEILDILDDNYLSSSITKTKYKSIGGKIET